MISLTINNHIVAAKANQTVLEAATANGINIPTLCHLPRSRIGDKPRAVCRICVVEIKGVNGHVSACSAIVADGMQVLTQSQSVLNARRVLMEFIVAENQNMNTDDQTRIKQLSDELGVSHARFTLPAKTAVDPEKYLSEFLNVDPALCIHCDRCIQACQSRHVITRSDFGHTVSTRFGDSSIESSDCTYCGDCVAVCPGGGITRA